MNFSSADRKILASVVATFVEIPNQATWIDSVSIANKIAALIAEKSPEEQADFRQLLDLLESPFLGFTWGGAFRSFENLSAEERQSLFRSWSASRFALLRKGYQALKKLSTFIAYSLCNESGQSFSQPITQYQAHQETSNTEQQAIPLIKPGIGIRCEVLIVGSGAGGGVAAARYAQAGKDVLIVEKGPWMPEQEMTNLEAEMVSQLYEERGALSTVDGAMTVFAGACLGGGTTINWQACIKTPDFVLEEWAEESGIADFAKPVFQNHLDSVWKRLGANREEVIHNTNNQLLIKGSNLLGQEINPIAKNSSHCNSDGAHRCGWCGFGCKQGSKQSTLKTYIQDAIELGTRILDRTYIERLLFSGNQVIGAEGFHTDPLGNKTEVRIHCERVIVSAGSIHSPALLMRSGIRHPELGKNLYLHPVVPVPAIYSHEVKAWSGAMMTSTNDEHIRLNGRYGYKIETPPPHPGLLALGMPWKDAQSFQVSMAQISHLGVFIVLSRDEFSGAIRLSKDGRPMIDYSLHANDKARLIHGMKNTARLHAAAGAKEIALPHVQPTFVDATVVNDIARFDKLIDEMRWDKGDYTLFSAHQMGTCRMGTSYSHDVINPEGKVWGVNGVYVVDASVFPKSSGANPMVSILAISDYLCSQQLG